MNLGANIWSFFYEPLQDIWESIQSLPDIIIGGINELLVMLFVPEEGYFENKFNDIRTTFISKIGVDVDDLEVLQDADGVNLDNLGAFSGTIYGQNVKFVDLSFLDEIKPMIHNLARGFIYPLLLLYNMNQIYFLIRGVNLFSRSKGDDE